MCSHLDTITNFTYPLSGMSSLLEFLCEFFNKDVSESFYNLVCAIYNIYI